LFFACHAPLKEERETSVLCGLPMAERSYREGLLATTKDRQHPRYACCGQELLNPEFEKCYI
jgi:hypothetical protein